MKHIASCIDHTLLSPLVTEHDIQRLCQEAIEYQFKTVCVSPVYVKLAADFLTRSTVDVCTVIGFPLGYTTSETKLFESQKAISDGANELDVVMNMGFFKSGNYHSVQEELSVITQWAHRADTLVKVIIETANWSKEEIAQACMLCSVAGVDFVKTSTGFASQGATMEAVEWMRQTLPESIQIKASGGIRSYKQAMAFIQAGATRIGTSAGITIVQEQGASLSF